MTKRQAIYKHRRMWRWIAEETRERRTVVDKTDYFIEHALLDERPNNLCWCCGYASSVCRGEQPVDAHLIICDACPIQWSGITCCDIESEYCQWDDAVKADDWEEAAHWAAVIAELPEVENE